MSIFFQQHLKDHDPAIFDILKKDLIRQQNNIELIASENLVSHAVLEAQGSILTNKYAEGYPGKRYYGGCEYVDQVELLAIQRLTQLMNCKFANVQPNSGSQANQAVFLALMNPGDSFLGMSLNAGGHLTHGSPVNMSGKWFHPIPYDVDPETHLIDYDQVRRLAHEHKPKLVIAGGSAYSRIIDFKIFREIADEVGALLMVDMAHFAGLVAGEVYPNPCEHAHVVTSTTHKTLRGPRGGIVLSNHEDIMKKINSAIFPGLQGGPLMHVITAKAVAFGEALQPEFKTYIQQVIKNAQTLAKSLLQHGYHLASGGTDSHLILVDLRPKGVTGQDAERSLERAGLTCNKNTIPFDPTSPRITSGIRLGSPAMTTRGFKESDFEETAKLINQVLEGIGKNGIEGNGAIEQEVKDQVITICKQFPIYTNI